MTLQALLEDLVYFDDDMLYEHCKQEIKFSCRNMTHVIHDGLFWSKKAQKWSFKRSTIRNELRNKCKTSNCLVLDTQHDLYFENPFFSFFGQKKSPKMYLKIKISHFSKILCNSIIFWSCMPIFSQIPPKTKK